MANETVTEYEWLEPRQGTNPDGSTWTRSDRYRMGQSWFAEEYQALIDAVLEGATTEEIAQLLARSPGSISSRISRLLQETPNDPPHTGPRVEALRLHIENNPDYDWRDAVRAREHVLLTYADARHLATQDPADPAAALTTAEHLGITPEHAARLIRRFSTTRPADEPKRRDKHWASPLRVKNLLAPATGHLPTRAHPGDAGMDLRYAGDTAVTVTATRHTILPTGIAVAIPAGYAGLLTPRSGLAAKHGLTIVNSPGVIDHGYTGEVKVLAITLGDATVTIEPGERIAQLLLTPVATPDPLIVDDLDDTDRGTGGLGSTGRA